MTAPESTHGGAVALRAIARRLRELGTPAAYRVADEVRNELRRCIADPETRSAVLADLGMESRIVEDYHEESGEFVGWVLP